MLFVAAVLLVTTPCLAHSRTKPHKLFPATGGSVQAENEWADSLGLKRYVTEREMEADIERGLLVKVPINVSPKLPSNRRYVLPATAEFMSRLNEDFRSVTGKELIVDSAVRPATVQKRLCRWNRNAAPANGARASSHERGTTFDLGKRQLTKAEYQWLLFRLFYYRERGLILVIEERACLHVFVGGDHERTRGS